MTIFKIDYTNWANGLKNIAQSVDNNDNTEGLSNSKEIIDFFNQAIDSGYKTDDINELLGLKINLKSPMRKAPASDNSSELINYFNSLDYNDRSNLIYAANDVAYERLSTMEQEINKAFEECKGYGLIKTRRDLFEDRTRFDIQQVHDDVLTALNSINELQEKMEKAYDKAKGKTGTKAVYEDYEKRVADIAISTLDESYESFTTNYNLDFAKTITEAEAYDPTYENKIVYDKARNYVNKIKKLAREELQRTRTESGERLLDETIKYSNSFTNMIDFESEDITDKSVSDLESDIMRQAFLEAVSKEFTKTGIEDTKSDSEIKDGKYYDKEQGVYIIKNGKKYNTNGTSIK